MKRFFILATAAIVALASCAKTEVVYKDAPEQIAFKQITGVMTKAEFTDNLGVFAYQGTNKHFDDMPFVHNGTNWTNADAVWPYEGQLTFTVYAPHTEYGASLNGSVLTVANVEAAENVYYGATQVTTAKTDEVDVVLRHMAAKVTVEVDLGAYTLTSLTLNDACTSGEVNVNYGTTPATVAVAENTGSTQSLDMTEESVQYVLPGAQTSFTIEFTQGALSFEKTLTLPTANWVANTAYTYNITVADPEQIYISASVAGWDPSSPVTVPVQ